MREHIGGFLEAIYKDSVLKNRFILWTFVVLVFPAAVLVAFGVPEKLAYVTMAALILPLQFLLYLLSRPRIMGVIGEVVCESRPRAAALSNSATQRTVQDQKATQRR